MTDAATGTETLRVKIDLPSNERAKALFTALADAHRDVKRLRSQARYADRTLAKLEESIYGYLGIGYRKVS